MSGCVKAGQASLKRGPLMNLSNPMSWIEVKRWERERSSVCKEKSARYKKAAIALAHQINTASTMSKRSMEWSTYHCRTMLYPSKCPSRIWHTPLFDYWRSENREHGHSRCMLRHCLRVRTWRISETKKRNKIGTIIREKFSSAIHK